jgi:hypothetical protein
MQVTVQVANLQNLTDVTLEVGLHVPGAPGRGTGAEPESEGPENPHVGTGEEGREKAPGEDLGAA